MAELKRKPSPALAAMTKQDYAKLKRDIKDRHEAADDAAIEVATGYKTLKKRGINLDAFKLVLKLTRLDNPAKIQAFLADFDRLRELEGFDDQQQLFEEDKTKPQKDAAAAGDKVVQLNAGKEPAKSKDKPKVGKSKKADGVAAELASPPAAPLDRNKDSWGKAGESKPASRAALFDEGDDDAEVAQVAAEVTARQRGIAAGASGEDYENPYDDGEEREEFHAGWIIGCEQHAMGSGQQASA